MKKQSGVANVGAEEVAQVVAKAVTRADKQTTLHTLLSSAPKAQRKDKAKIEKLFVQAPAVDTMAPNLQKLSEALREPEYLTKNIDAFFEKLASGALYTDAQRRYPELLKVSGGSITKSPTLSKRTVSPAKGSSPVSSALSGGSA